MLSDRRIAKYACFALWICFSSTGEVEEEDDGVDEDAGELKPDEGDCLRELDDEEDDEEDDDEDEVVVVVDVFIVDADVVDSEDVEEDTPRST